MLLDNGTVKFTYDGTYLKAYTWVEDTPSENPGDGSGTTAEEEVK